MNFAASNFPTEFVQNLNFNFQFLIVLWSFFENNFRALFCLLETKKFFVEIFLAKVPNDLVISGMKREDFLVGVGWLDDGEMVRNESWKLSAIRVEAELSVAFSGRKN